MQVKKMVLSSVLVTVALTIFMIEAQLPPILPIPGVKLGLANIVTLFALYLLGAREAIKIQYLRIILGCMFTGQAISLMYSLAGGTLCLIIMILLSKLLPRDMIWLVGIFMAVAHIAGQMLIAVWILGFTVLYYLPIVLISAIVAGFFTGLSVQYILQKYEKTFRKFQKNNIVA